MVVSGSLASPMRHWAPVSCEALPDPCVEAAEKLAKQRWTGPQSHFDKDSMIASTVRKDCRSCRRLQSSGYGYGRVSEVKQLHAQFSHQV